MSKSILCRWCGVEHAGMCGMVKAIEYFANGKVKRVEFKTMADNMPAQIPSNWPIPASQPAPTRPEWGPIWVSTPSPNTSVAQ